MKVEKAYFFEMWLKKQHVLFSRNNPYSITNPMTVYGLPQDFNNDIDIDFTPVEESDLKFFKPSLFRWFDHYIPRFQSIVENPELSHVYYENWDNYGNRTIFNLNCPLLGRSLMIDIFSSNPEILECAKRMCAHSLTKQQWDRYLIDWELYYENERASDPNFKGVFIRPDFEKPLHSRPRSRPYTLNEEPSIEVRIHLFCTYENAEAQPFHIDDPNCCIPGRGTDKKTNYMHATILLPGSSEQKDRISTCVSSINREWEHEDCGIWLPCNVVHHGREFKGDVNAIREVYMIEMFSNGSGDMLKKCGHNPTEIKAFTLSISELLACHKLSQESALAFAMGGHSRLGNVSPVITLNDNVVKTILEMAKVAI
jgi:hypothetical protein